jgi:hypothetical protein
MSFVSEERRGKSEGKKRRAKNQGKGKGKKA